MTKRVARMVAAWLLLVASPVVRADDGPEYVATLCTSCHGTDLVAQQRLTAAQWEATIDKMIAWGAQADDELKAELVPYLAATFGPDAGPFEPPRISATAAREAVEAQPDGPFADGDADRGRTLYEADCAGCHAADGHGDLGPNLVDESFLDRAAEFATVVRDGRGEMMPGRPMDDADVAAVLAFLRAQ